MAKPIVFFTSYPIAECRQRLQQALKKRVTYKLFGITLSDHPAMYGKVAGDKFYFSFPGRIRCFLDGKLIPAPAGTLIQVKIPFPLAEWLVSACCFALGISFLFSLHAAPVLAMGVTLSLFSFGAIWLGTGIVSYHSHKPRLIRYLQDTLKATVSQQPSNVDLN